MKDLKMSDLEIAKERFWSKVDIRGEDECWPWLAGKSGEYGYFTIRHGLQVPSSALAYALTYGPVSQDTPFACHKCDNPPCCNPKHIFMGTHHDNMEDMRKKCRSPKTKLDWEKVRAIRQESKDGRSQRFLERKYGVSHNEIGYIVRGETWKE